MGSHSQSNDGHRRYVPVRWHLSVVWKGQCVTIEHERAGEQQSLEILEDRTQAWWMSVLAGQVAGSHPVHGTDIKATVDGDILTLSGRVPSEEDRRLVEAEVAHLKGQNFSAVHNELEVIPENEDEKGLLVQSIIAIFETEAQAGFAEGYLEGHIHVRPELMHVIAPQSSDAGYESLRAMVPEAYWNEAKEALEGQRALLIVTVDETEAFKTRELLEEETKSLRTLVLPPEPAGNTAPERRALDRVQQSPESEGVIARAEDARRYSLEEEKAVHES